jgi:hypothetical protein
MGEAQPARASLRLRVGGLERKRPGVEAAQTRSLRNITWYTINNVLSLVVLRACRSVGNKLPPTSNKKTQRLKIPEGPGPVQP